MGNYPSDSRFGGQSTGLLGGIATGVGSFVTLFFILAWFFSVKVGPGEEAVLVDKPLVWGHGGVRSEPVKTGRTYIWPTTDSIPVEMRPQQFSEKFADLMSRDGVPLDFDAALRTQVLDSVALIEKFGEQWYENNVAVEFRNRVRQSVRKYGMNETAIDTAAVEKIDVEVSEALDSYLKSAGIPVKLIQVTVGKANPPDMIKTQRIETAREEQRKLTEDQRKKAEDARLEAETSRAAADNAYRTSMDLSPEQFVTMEAIKAQREVCKDGNCTFVIGTQNPGVVLPLPHSDMRKAAVTPTAPVEEEPQKASLE
jgi:regulator of protease activity HflC (stomatin/prohibitin superfamily)